MDTNCIDLVSGGRVELDNNEYYEAFNFKNLYEAHLKCRRGKRHKSEVVNFEMNLSENLTNIHRDLTECSYRMKGYYNFVIKEPKTRKVYATRYQDRIVIRCLCDNVLKKYIGPRLIYDNAACQVNKGTHFALDRLKLFLRKHYKLHGNKGYVLKCDISQYFASINHKVLKEQFRNIIKNSEILNLIDHYIETFEFIGNNGEGIPLGNQSSQWIGIFYMNGLDRMIKEELKIKYYIRYMDDFILIHRDKKYLQYCLNEVERYINQELKLQLNPKTEILPLKHGFECLGWRIYLSDTGKVVKYIKRQSKLRMKRRIRKINEEYESGERTYDSVNRVINSYQAHLNHGNTYQLRKVIYKELKLRDNKI